jgi:hypothetical protein
MLKALYKTKYENRKHLFLRCFLLPSGIYTAMKAALSRKFAGAAFVFSDQNHEKSQEV